jgi:hypothetical protein
MCLSVSLSLCLSFSFSSSSSSFICCIASKFDIFCIVSKFRNRKLRSYCIVSNFDIIIMIFIVSYQILIWSICKCLIQISQVLL